MNETLVCAGCGEQYVIGKDAISLTSEESMDTMKPGGGMIFGQLPVFLLVSHASKDATPESLAKDTQTIMRLGPQRGWECGRCHWANGWDLKYNLPVLAKPVPEKNISNKIDSAPKGLLNRVLWGLITISIISGVASAVYNSLHRWRASKPPMKSNVVVSTAFSRVSVEKDAVKTNARNLEDLTKAIKDVNLEKAELVVQDLVVKSDRVDSDSLKKNVSIGSFVVSVESKWQDYTPSELDVFTRQYKEQSKQIYEQFSGQVEDPAKSVDVAAFHINGDSGSFVIVAFTVPPQSDFISLLKSQVADKMDWGVKEGYIKQYLGMVPVDDENFSGFYTKTVGNDGNFEVSGGLEHKERNNVIIQVTLLCPKDWDESTAENTYISIIKSVKFENKADSAIMVENLIEKKKVFLKSSDKFNSFLVNNSTEIIKLKKDKLRKSFIMTSKNIWLLTGLISLTIICVGGLVLVIRKRNF